MAPNQVAQNQVSGTESGQLADASVGSTMITLTANILGSGMYSLPWVLKQATCVTGIIFMVFIGLLSSTSFVLLALCCERTGTFNYLEMARRALGDSFAMILMILQVCCLLHICYR